MIKKIVNKDDSFRLPLHLYLADTYNRATAVVPLSLLVGKNRSL